MRTSLASLSLLACGLAAVTAASAQEAKPAASKKIEPAAVNLGRPVSFEQDIYPILDSNCVACHNIAINESKLVLEDVASILKGGKRGPSVVAKDPEKSLLYLVMARAKDPVMPPLPNKVGATAVTPQQLGLMRQWILEGATAGMGTGGSQVNFSPIPSSLKAVYSVGTSPLGRFAAAGRANQLILIDMATAEEIGRVIDPALNAIQFDGKPMYPGGAAHRDFVHSLAFSPTQNLLASGDFRAVKLWKRPDNAQKAALPATEAVTAIAATADGKLAAVATADKAIQIINLATNQPGKKLAGHTDVITGLRFSLDGTKLYSGSKDKSLRTWNVAEGTELSRVDSPAPINGLATNADGTILITAGADNFARSWAVPATPNAQIATTDAAAPALAVSPDKKWLAIAAADGKVNLIDLATNQPARTLTGHVGAVNSISWSGTSARLATAGLDKTVRIWDVATGAPVAILTGHAGPVNAVALSPNGNQAVSGGADNSLKIWKLDTPAVRPLVGDNGQAVTVAAVSNEGKFLAVGATAGGKPAVLVRDIASGNITHTLAGFEGPITSVAFSLDNTKVVAGSADKTARVWTLADSKEVAKFPGHANTVTAVAFHPNNAQVVSGAADNTLKLWALAENKEIANCAGHGGAVTGVGFTAGGAAIISASADQTIRLWNPANGAQTASFPHGTPVTSLAVSRDGTKLATTGADNNVRLLQSADGKVLFTMAGHAAAGRTAAFSGDGTRVVSTAADKQAIVWDVATGTANQSFVSPQDVTSATFTGQPAADGSNTILIATGDKAITWQPVSFERPLVGYTMPITDVAYAPDGTAVFASSVDGTVRRFLVQNGQQQFSANHGAPIHDIAVSVNGQLLATAGENKEVRVWNAANGGPGAKPNLAGFDAAVKSVEFAPDNLRLVAGAANGQVLVFNTTTGLAEQGYGQHTGAVEAVAITGEKGDRVITASADKSVRAWSLVALKQFAGHTGPVTTVEVVTPPGTQILTGSDDGTIKHWDLAAGTMIRQMAHGGPVTGLAVRADGQIAASSSANNSIKLWTLNNGQQKVEMKGDAVTTIVGGQPLPSRPVALAIEKQNLQKQLAALADAAVKTAEASVKERDEALKKAVEAKTAAEKALTDLAPKVKAAQDKVAAAKTAFDAKKDDKNLEKAVMDAEKAAQTEVDNEKKAKEGVDGAERSRVLAEKAAQQAKEKVTQTTAEKDAATKKQMEVDAAVTAATTAATATEKPVRGLAISTDGKKLATVGDDGLVRLWDADAGSPLETYTGHQGVVGAVAFAGPSIISGGADKKAIIWDTNPAWQLVATLGPPKEAPLDVAKSPFISRVLSLAFSPDGKTLATGGGDPSRSGELMLWNVENPAAPALIRDMKESHSDTVLGIEFSYDGKQLVTGAADKFVKLFDVATGKHIRSFEGHTNHVLDVSIKADGTTIVSSGADNAIKVWNIDTGEQARTIQNYTKQVPAIQFIGITEDLVSCGGDATVKMHKSTNGQNFRNLAGAVDFVYSAAPSRDGRFVIAGGEDGIIRLWNAVNGQLIKQFDPPKPPETNTQAAADAKK